MQELQKRLYTAHAEATGGRNGTTHNASKVVSVKLAVPKEMGGPGGEGTTTPEDLFAAGYAACFGSACEFAARQKKIAIKGIRVAAEVAIGPIAPGGFGLAVSLAATVIGVTPEQAEEIVHAGHAVCPYSNATRNNIAVEVSAHAEA
jgi:osmotically inducible protein OsmC